jgi:hypothetical protein
MTMTTTTNPYLTGEKDDRGYLLLDWDGWVGTLTRSAGELKVGAQLEVGTTYRLTHGDYCSCNGCGRATHYAAIYLTSYRDKNGVRGVWSRCREHQDKWEALGRPADHLARPATVRVTVELDICTGCFEVRSRSGACSC